MLRHIPTGIAIALVIVFTATVSLASSDELFRGQVMSTQGNELAVSVGGDIVTFEVAPKAVISIDGQPAELGQLLPDHIVEVTAERSGEEWTATWIEASSQRVVLDVRD